MKRWLNVFWLLVALAVYAEGPPQKQFVTLEPYVITNYVKPTGRLGFVNAEVVLVVLGAEDQAALEENLPLVEDYVTQVLSAAPEETLRDVKKRNGELRQSVLSGLQKLLAEEVGRPLVQDVLFTKFLVQ